MPFTIAELAPGAASKTPWKVTVPKAANMSMIATDIPMSPTRLTTKAFLAAGPAVSRVW